MTATHKQIELIERLLREKQIDSSIYESIEAKAVRCGMGCELSTRQASRFIELLMSRPNDPNVKRLATGKQMWLIKKLVQENGTDGISEDINKSIDMVMMGTIIDMETASKAIDALKA